MKCWRDDAQAYSFAEVAINWNAPLAWMAAWASEHGSNPPSTHPGLTGMGVGGGGASGSGGNGGQGPVGGGGTSGTGGTTSPGEPSGGGCGCALAPSSASGAILIAGLLVSLGVAARRRRAKRTR